MPTNELLYYTKNPIPFPGARVSLHNPEIEEIAVISEDTFQRGLQLLEFQKDNLTAEDKKGLESKTDFDILMSIIQAKERRDSRRDILSVLTILFPDYEVQISYTKGFVLKKDEENFIIDGQNFSEFKNILSNTFNFGEKAKKEKYNPVDNKAKRIAEKLQKSRNKINKLKNKEENISLFKHYISVLSVGLQMDWNVLTHYTVNQIINEFERFNKKEAYEIYVKSKLAGAKDIETVDHWENDEKE